MVVVARQFVARTLRDWGAADTGIADAVLLTSELMSNAVLHARTDVRLTVLLDARGTMRVELRDENPRAPIVVQPETEAASGRGLWLVQTLAAAWGFELGDGGKVVWFEVGDGARRSADACADMTDVGSVEEALDRIDALAEEDGEKLGH